MSNRRKNSGEGRGYVPIDIPNKPENGAGYVPPSIPQAPPPTDQGGGDSGGGDGGGDSGGGNQN